MIQNYTFTVKMLSNIKLKYMDGTTGLNINDTYVY